jgi:hypothetical protein
MKFLTGYQANAWMEIHLRIPETISPAPGQHWFDCEGTRTPVVDLTVSMNQKLSAGLGVKPEDLEVAEILCSKHE